jgi:hypothetical protein
MFWVSLQQLCMIDGTHLHVCTSMCPLYVQPTPPMSTYLLAWVMARLTSVNTTCTTEYGPVPLGVWATPSRCDNATVSIKGWRLYAGRKYASGHFDAINTTM